MSECAIPSLIEVEYMFTYISCILGIPINTAGRKKPYDSPILMYCGVYDDDDDMIFEEEIEILLKLGANYKSSLAKLMKAGIDRDEIEYVERLTDYSSLLYLYRSIDDTYDMILFAIANKRVHSVHLAPCLASLADNKLWKRAHARKFASTLAYITCNPKFGTTYLEGVEEIFNK